ncbi:sugar ABC transporter substrate-binding protein [Kribbella solani]|uniref:ABC-type sugar transport system substrate-binding protein n=1 Tax=Kribbella solani TaxID=236067 RepID=A0A841DLE5_9ACTN|nr:substrate-binding domain-containing protein [Kribbella solani]MBB5979924.1 ABC-type sugar transport system substrate-binding protein [Kribbella solani]MDX2968151.1 substrate-binding domain-containing protein [Kribbella solani]MDX3004836.1 substrate-binding domain-containing protein [Kribbella solani]
MKFHSRAAVLGAGALCLLLTACGSGSDAGAQSAVPSNPAAKAALAEAKAVFAEYSATKSLEPIPALPDAPPKGKRFVIVTCNFPTCASVADGAKAAAQALGWNTTVLQHDSTPQSYVSLMNQVASDPPDALAYVPALPDSSLREQLTKLKSAGTKISEISPPEQLGPDSGVEAFVLGKTDVAQTGKILGSAVVADAGGAVDAVWVWDPSFATAWSPMKDGFTKVVESVGGKVGVLEASVQGVGKSVPSQITGYLQAHPKTKYVVTPMVDYQSGLTPALQAAGLQGKVKVISRATNQAVLEGIKNGTDWAGLAIELQAEGWRSVDQLVRLVMGVPLGDRADHIGWQQIYLKNNVDQAGTAPEPPNYQQTYISAWTGQ